VTRCVTFIPQLIVLLLGFLTMIYGFSSLPRPEQVDVVRTLLEQVRAMKPGQYTVFNDRISEAINGNEPLDDWYEFLELVLACYQFDLPTHP
jgi:hypothetical protein